ncbi:AAA family ATPase [Flavobacterium sp. TAB 87]|uniref:AAA family ATPase n=1 Tax=Flavobacterium sp. TAB 87 TaxID=1729581 RepID=UPI00076BF9F4|nr:AAA family ATPase [Flavobacterium sp. TAB 87]KVV16382.1 chromosome segregation protein [Flavobacterium sp. TAB 87]
MGSLIIEKVKYSGDKYVYESPLLTNGINLIVGDNGSGKSTFTYFIEYCLGNNIKYFEKDHNKKYTEIVNDTNNFVELDILINSKKYQLKRFINKNDIFINDNGEISILPIKRNQNKIFSDWLLEKLDISISELNMGTYSWKLNFSDLLRLIIYDQDTESKKIYKAPIDSNFVSDSLIIRKTVFEVLLGISSDEYFKKHDELKIITKKKDSALSSLNDFNEKYNGVDLEKNGIENKLKTYNETLEKVYSERKLYLSSNTKIDEKAEFINGVQDELIQTDLKISENNIKLNGFQIEYNNISKLYENQQSEIKEIEKIIFTNDKLNLFSFKLCPFCMSNHEPKTNHCLCGSEIKDENYEKFVYNSNEYEVILKHKSKSIETLQIALDSYFKQITSIKNELIALSKKSNDLTIKLKKLISSIEFSGNTELVDSLNDKILETKKDVDKFEYLLEISINKEKLEETFDSINEKYKSKSKEFRALHLEFVSQNKSLITEFNEIYSDLLQKSSAGAEIAEIDDDYMPIIDGGVYKNKSADVPLRLMYYFTILALSLKNESVKHPGLLIIDTPEDSGIDKDNLKKDLDLLNFAIEQGKNSKKEYQIILTTGLNKYPDSFKDNIKDRFNKIKGIFILKEKNANNNV